MKFGTLHQILNPITVTWPKITVFEIQDGDWRHLENRFFGHYSLTDCPISAKFCMRKQNGMLTRATGQKMQMCKIQDGGWPPFRKSLNRPISVKNCPILMKFCTLHQILNSVTVTSPKIGIYILQSRQLATRSLLTTVVTARLLTGCSCVHSQWTSPASQLDSAVHPYCSDLIHNDQNHHLLTTHSSSTPCHSYHTAYQITIVTSFILNQSK